MQREMLCLYKSASITCLIDGSRLHPCPDRPKDWADIVEAWFGAVIKDRLLWDEDDRLEELNLFIEQIWRLRYRGLKDYFIGKHNVTHGNDDYEVEVTKERAVIVPGNKLMASIIETSSRVRTIGYQVSARIKRRSRRDKTNPVKCFATTLAKAKDVAVQLAINSREGEYPMI